MRGQAWALVPEFSTRRCYLFLCLLTEGEVEASCLLLMSCLHLVQIQAATIKQCGQSTQDRVCTTALLNQSEFCNRMNDRSMYP